MKECDVVFIGGGPAGLSGGITSSSERIKTIILESYMLGGQAGQSSLIENLFGFHEGIPGAELTSRARAQALKFGCDVSCPFNVGTFAKDGDKFIIRSVLGEEVCCSALVYAGGLTYRTLEAKNIGFFIGSGISYGMPTFDGKTDPKKIFIVGGANSAGQAAHNLAVFNTAYEVILAVRGSSIEDTMSGYLIDKLKKTPNVQVWTHTEVLEVVGDTRLTALVLKRDGQTVTEKADGLHIFIGATPKTGWIKDNGLFTLDDKGFALTGKLVHGESWVLQREPFGYETSTPGVFAVGDVRLNSIKRVATSAGEGAGVVAQLHQYLNQLHNGGSK